MSSSDKKIRVVVAKPGLDGHDRGAKIIARALRDAGVEVIYTGLHQTPEQIVETVIQEDADAVGLSILSGAHMTLVPRIMELLAAQGVDDVVVTVGGTIPADDIEELKSLGVAEVFTPGAPTQQAIDFIRGAVRPELVRPRRSPAAWGRRSERAGRAPDRGGAGGAPDGGRAALAVRKRSTAPGDRLTRQSTGYSGRSRAEDNSSASSRRVLAQDTR